MNMALGIISAVVEIRDKICNIKHELPMLNHAEQSSAAVYRSRTLSRVNSQMQFLVVKYLSQRERIFTDKYFVQ